MRVCSYVVIATAEELDGPLGLALSALVKESWRKVRVNMGCYAPEYESNGDEWSMSAIVSLLSDAEGRWLLGLGADGAPVSAVAASICEHAGSRAMVLKRLVVHPDSQGQGLAAALVDRAAAEALAERASYLTLFTSSLFTRLVALYESCGFVEYARTPVEAYGTRYDRVFLARPLTPARTCQ